MEQIRLSDAIENLREELTLTQEKGENKSLKFNIDSLEIELEVIAEREEGTSGKINWWVLGGEADLKRKDAYKHKLKLSLQAVEVNENGSEGRLKVSQERNMRAE